MKEMPISKQNLGTRLFAKDNLHLTKKVKELRFSDPRFKDNSTAIRHYVHLGIITEIRTRAINTLDDRTIKTAQKEVVTDSLLPVKNSIDALIRAVEKSDEKQQGHFQESNRIMDRLVRRIEGLNEAINNHLSQILKEVMTTGKVSEESLRNVIVLRSIHYIFLLGYKTGRIEPSDHTAWEKVVAFAHTKAQELSIEEITHLADGNMENEIVQKLSSDLFNSIRRLQPRVTVA